MPQNAQAHSTSKSISLKTNPLVENRFDGYCILLRCHFNQRMQAKAWAKTCNEQKTHNEEVIDLKLGENMNSPFQIVKS